MGGTPPSDVPQMPRCASNIGHSPAAGSAVGLHQILWASAGARAFTSVAL